MKYAMVRLKDGTDIIGEILEITERGIDIGGACIIRYSLNEDRRPTVALMKYCALVAEFNVFFSNENVLHIFNDPLPNVVEYYEKVIEKIKADYLAAFENKGKTSNVFSLFDDVGSEKDDDSFLALLEMYSSNTTIQ